MIVGAGSVILPGVTIGDGAALGALSLAKSDCPAFKVCAGVPARVVKDRSRNLLDLEKKYLEDHA